jgi:hypothetical protein
VPFGQDADADPAVPVVAIVADEEMNRSRFRLPESRAQTLRFFTDVAVDALTVVDALTLLPAAVNDQAVSVKVVAASAGSVSSAAGRARAAVRAAARRNITFPIRQTHTRT